MIQERDIRQDEYANVIGWQKITVVHIPTGVFAIVRRDEMPWPKIKSKAEALARQRLEQALAKRRPA